MGKRKSKKQREAEAEAIARLAAYIYALNGSAFCDALCEAIVDWGNAFNTSILAAQGKEASHTDAP